MRTLLVAIGLTALLAVPAMAAEGPPPQSEQVAVTLTIEQYCYANMAGSFNLLIDGGYSSASASASLSFSAGANFSAVITDELIPPTGAPGDWSNDISYTGSFPGEVTGTVTVTVENVEYADGTGYWDGGTKTITISVP